jgi:Zc3h12a-like Ribonuclease NYN domain
MPKHVVVDGSNIATEGRAMPSLKQLNEAVMAYIQDHPDQLVTVVVDATFGHRIDPREIPEFDAAVENNELVSPPAGAIGRGDAFVLTIANKANAIVLSNDSFQEFHGEYDWLFEEGRLIGGKPVPHVGWVFVPRAPVRGPISRRSVRDATRPKTAVASRTHGRPSKLASEPMPVPKAPPPSGRTRTRKKVDAEPVAPSAAPGVAIPTGVRHAPINDLLPFISFVEQHPIGSTVEATTESYSSHGAYVTVGDVRAYVPLRYLGDPAPRSARDVMAMGEAAPFVVVSFNASRRGIDLAKPEFAPATLAAPDLDLAALAAAPAKKAAKRTRKAAKVPAAKVPAAKFPAVGVPAAAEVEPVVAPEPPAVAKKAPRRARKAAAVVEEAPPVEVVEPVPAAVVEVPKAPTPAKKAAKRARKAAKAPVVVAAPEPVAVAAPKPAPAPAKKAAKRARKTAKAPVAAAPEPVISLPEPEPEPVVAPVKKAAKRARKSPAAAAG